MKPSLAAAIGRLLPIGVVLVAAGSSGCAEGEPQAPVPPSARPNLIVITLDTTRRDAVGFHGRSPSPTPVLDRLAAEAVVFEDAYAPAPLTLPSHCSLMTGLAPRQHGVRDNSVFRVPEEASTLAERLRDEGYATAAAVSAYVLDGDFGIDQGFSTYLSPPRSPGQAGASINELPADRTVDRALGLLEELPSPFFLWVHLFDPHFPYAPPDPPRVLPAEENERNRALYDAEIRFADQQLGRLFAALRQRGVLDDSVLVFASDHGEWVGEQGPEKTHGRFILDPTMRVPLWIRAPGLAPYRATGPVSLVDVTPTVLGLLGVPGPADAGGGAGRDLSGQLSRGEHGDPSALLDLESYGLYLAHGLAPYEGLVDGRFKFIHSARDQLVDRAEDPGEQTDASAEHPEVAARMRARLEERYGAEALLPHRGFRADVERLRALGYVAAEQSRDGSRPEDFESLGGGMAARDLLEGMDAVNGAFVAGRWEVAIRRLRALAAAHPGSALVHEQWGVACLSLALSVPDPERRARLLRDAERHLERALALQFERVQSHYNLALVMKVRGSEAEGRAAQAADAGDEKAAARHAEEASGLRERLRSHLEIAVSLEPTSPEVLVNLCQLEEADGRALEEAGDPQSAAESYARALSRLRVFLDTVPREHEHWPTFQLRSKQLEARVRALRDG